MPRPRNFLDWLILVVIVIIIAAILIPPHWFPQSMQKRKAGLEACTVERV